MFDGYDQALTRFQSAAKRRDAAPAFIALFEALNWAVALDERAAERWTPEGQPLGYAWRERVRGAHLMQAVRFARNGVHHQWSDALERNDGGMSFPMTFPLVFFEWRWRPLAELPPSPPTKRLPEEQEAYRSWLEGKPARVTLHELGGAFGFLRLVLEPATIPRRPGADLAESEAAQ